jgi:hypothetical protein
MRGQPVNAVLPDFLRAFREEGVGLHIDGTVVFPDAGDGDVAERDLFHGASLRIRRYYRNGRRGPAGAVSVR